MDDTPLSERILRMDDATLARRILLTGLVIATLMLGFGCAAPQTIGAGSSICTAKTKAECDALSRVAASLHTKEMEQAIAEARR